jgi:hypothetical protein
MLVENIVAKGGVSTSELPSSIGQLNALLILFIKLLQFENIMKEVLIYWQIECIQSPSFVKVSNLK